MPSNEHPDMSGNPMDAPDICDQCEKAISDFARFGTELDEDKNFCSLECMEAYNEEHGKPLDTESTGWRLNGRS